MVHRRRHLRSQVPALCLRKRITSPTIQPLTYNPPPQPRPLLVHTVALRVMGKETGGDMDRAAPRAKDEDTAIDIDTDTVKTQLAPLRSGDLPPHKLSCHRAKILN